MLRIAGNIRLNFGSSSSPWVTSEALQYEKTCLVEHEISIKRKPREAPLEGTSKACKPLLVIFTCKNLLCYGCWNFPQTPLFAIISIFKCWGISWILIKFIALRHDMKPQSRASHSSWVQWKKWRRRNGVKLKDDGINYSSIHISAGRR